MRSYRLPTSLVAVAVSLWGLWLSSAEPAELRVRKELLIKQADRALITATGRFDHVKEAVNSLQADCDLHAPVRVHEIKVAVVGEFWTVFDNRAKPGGSSPVNGPHTAWYAGATRGRY